MEANFNCSTPYVCLQEKTSLKWEGHNPNHSVIFNHQSLEPTGVSYQETLHTVLSWQDHGRTLRCQFSLAMLSSQKEVFLQVKREYITPLSLNSISVAPSQKKKKIQLV